jgi:uracil-DNA glycosylase family 4
VDTLNSLTSQIALQIAWGADEYLLDTPQDRRQAAKPVAAPPAPVAAAARTRVAAGALPAGPAEAAALAASCNSLEALRSALAGFTGCALRDTATQLVFADGPAQAQVMLIGEAPGPEEDRDGRPLIGPAGQLLDKMLGSIGLARGAVRVVNAVPWRPPGNRPPTAAEIAVCLPFLQRHVALARPSCLVLLGAVAAKAMLPAAGGAGIRRLRGSWHSAEIPGLVEKMPCLPTYHPTYLLHKPAAKREAWHDLLTLQSWLELPSSNIKFRQS